MQQLADIITGPLAPGLLTGALFFGLLPWLRRDSEKARAFAAAIAIVFIWRYMAWRIFNTLPPAALSLEFICGVIFLIAEFLTAIGATTTLIILSRTLSRSLEGDANAAWLAAQTPPLVDVFICTYNEDKAILDTTMVAALGIDYANFRVWVLDDGRRPWLETLCRDRGCHYLTRPDNSHAKAGNINNAIRHVAALPNPPDFVAIFDADFAAMANFLKRTLSLFKDGSVGIVQTPQHFSNPDPIQSNLAVTKVFPDEQRFFFDVIMPSRDAWGITICCGTSSVTRFAALRQIGGLPTESVTEDYLLTLRLQECGYKTIYLNERLSNGLAPEGLKEYATQRSRWCLGLIQICRTRFNPFRPDAPLLLRHRVGILESLLYWSVTFPFRYMCVVVPTLYWIFGIRTIHSDLGEALENYVPYLLTQMGIIYWISKGSLMPLLAEVSQLIIVTDIVKSVTVGLLKKKGHKFEVTAKGGHRDRVTVQWRMLRHFAALLAASVFGIAFAFLVDDNRFIEQGGALCLFWSWYNIGVLMICCLVCIEQPRFRKDERYNTEDRALLIVGDDSHMHDVIDISVGGFLLRGDVAAPIGATAFLALGKLRVPVLLVRKGDGQIALRVEGEEARAMMIRHLHSGRYGGAPLDVRGSRVAMKILQRTFR